MAAVYKTLTHQYLENKVDVFCILLPIRVSEICFGHSMATTSLECELILQLQEFDVRIGCHQRSYSGYCFEWYHDTAS